MFNVIDKFILAPSALAPPPAPLHILAVLPSEIKYRHSQNADRPEIKRPQWKGSKIILKNPQTLS